MIRSNYTRYEVVSTDGCHGLCISRKDTFDDVVIEINGSVERSKKRGYNNDEKWLILRVDGYTDRSDDGMFIASAVTRKAVAMYDNGTVTMIGDREKDKYEIGGFYYASNPLAGRNMQSGGTLVGWTESGKAVLYNKRWGNILATVENLDAHN